ncbi:MAG TPA: NAD-dependent epimerase/dehydratase family protein [bacterium]|nr:NAD-dependent epimerase/dehydratase family protein [bacterium]
MSFWIGKRVLVTGGAGFIGSHLVERLVALGAAVTVPLRSADARRDHLAGVLDRVALPVADLGRWEECAAAVAGHDVVMNLAARVGGIQYNIDHPASIFRENMTIFMNVIEAARIAGVKRFLVVSSACVYPRECSVPTPEEEGFAGTPEPTNEGYGWSKRMEEFLGAAYARQYGLSVAIARPYNAYGPRDNFNPDSSHVIPALIRRIFAGENPLRVWGTGEQTRTFLYVTDFVEGLIAAAERYPEADAVNIGSTEEVTIRDLAHLIVELSGRRVAVEFDVSRPGGQPRRTCDTAKAERVLGFHAAVPLREGLRRTIEWYATQVSRHSPQVR